MNIIQRIKRTLARENRTEVHFVVSHKSNNYFGINLPLIKLDEKDKFILPNGTRRVMIDIGTSANWPNSIDWLNRHPDDSVIIGIEPCIDAWCVAKILYFFADHLELLDGGPKTTYVKQEHTDRIIFLPVAIGNFHGYSLFNSNSSVGTSSILDSRTLDLGHIAKHKNLVPVVRLEEIIERIPEYIDYIEHLKVDAQGFDYEIVKSAGKLIMKCAVITVERNASSEYVHSYDDKDMIEYIRSKDFREIPNSRRYGSVSFINSKYENILGNLDYEIRV